MKKIVINWKYVDSFIAKIVASGAIVALVPPRYKELAAVAGTVYLGFQDSPVTLVSAVTDADELADAAESIVPGAKFAEGVAILDQAATVTKITQ